MTHMTNVEAAVCIKRKQEFSTKSGRLKGRTDRERNRYLVICQGWSCPVYIFDFAAERWFGCEAVSYTFRKTTPSHDVSWLNVEDMALYEKQGAAGLVAKKIARAALT